LRGYRIKSVVRILEGVNSYSRKPLPIKAKPWCCLQTSWRANRVPLHFLNKHGLLQWSYSEMYLTPTILDTQTFSTESGSANCEGVICISTQRLFILCKSFTCIEFEFSNVTRAWADALDAIFS
jgi:hypothetical protein